MKIFTSLVMKEKDKHINGCCQGGIEQSTALAEEQKTEK
jgi:hypothetical protein